MSRLYFSLDVDNDKELFTVSSISFKTVNGNVVILTPQDCFKDKFEDNKFQSQWLGVDINDKPLTEKTSLCLDNAKICEVLVDGNIDDINFSKLDISIEVETSKDLAVIRNFISNQPNITATIEKER